MRLGFFFILGFFAWPATPPVWAQETLTLLVRGQEPSPPYLGSLVSELVDSLNRTEGLLAVVPDGQVGQPSLSEGARRARALQEEARERYQKFDEAGALERLKDSRGALWAGCGGADPALLRSQQLLEGLVHFTAGRREEARRAFGLLAALDPTWEPDPQELAPKIVAAFQESKKETLERPRALVDLSGMPGGASVHFDGRKVGTIPILLEGVVPGVHCLEVSSPGYRGWVYRITVPEGGTVRLRAVLFPDQARVLLERGPGLPRGVDPGELSRMFSTSLLALGDASREEVVVYLLSATSGKVSRPARCRPVPQTGGELPGLVSCLVDGILQARRELGERPPPLSTMSRSEPEAFPALIQFPDVKESSQEPVASTRSAWYERWWFWAVLGGVVAGSGVGLVLLLQTGPSETGYRVVVTGTR